MDHMKRLIALIVFICFWCELALQRYFIENKLYLYVDCNENKKYSYCQRAYIFRYHSDTKTCSRFYRTDCIVFFISQLDINDGFTDITAVAQLSYKYFPPFILASIELIVFPSFYSDGKGLYHLVSSF